MSKALDVLLIINTAIKNSRLYPSSSSTIITTIDRLHNVLQDIFALQPDLIISESERKILINGEPLDQKESEKPHILSLLNLFLSWELKSITFNSGLTKNDLIMFMELLSNKPKDITTLGGLSEILKEKGIDHIFFDQKIYIAVDKNQQILSSLDITDDQIVKFLAHEHPELGNDQGKIEQMARNPEWLIQTFQSGMGHIMEGKGKISGAELSGTLKNMMVVLDKVGGKLDRQQQEKISQQIGKSVAALGKDVAEDLISQNIEHLFSGLLLQYIAGELAEFKSREAGLSGTAKSNRNMVGGSITQNQIRSGFGLDAGAGPLSSNSSIDLKKNLSLLIKDKQAFEMNESLMISLPDIIKQLISQKQQETLELVIKRIVENLANRNGKIRAYAANSLVEILGHLPAAQKENLISRLADQLLEWLRQETLATASYKIIFDYIQELVQSYINQGRFKETFPILDLFNDIYLGKLDKNDTIHAIAVESIRALATEDNLTKVFSIFETGDESIQLEAGGILVRLGDNAINHLLDILKDNTDSNERVRIMKLIIGAGPRGVPLVRDRITKNTPWYFLRNLSYMLGYVGNEESSLALKPLLLHTDHRVRQEALRSIQRAGGNERASILLSVLKDADDRFKIKIIEALGAIKSIDAVPALLEMLKNRKLITVEHKLGEQICATLGAIGSPKAIATLKEIIETKSFLKIYSYPDVVRGAANRALVSIDRKMWG